MTAGHQTELWHSLPKELARLFRPSLDGTTAEILHELHTSISEYARPWDSEFDKVITAAVHQAMIQFLDRLVDPAAPQPDLVEMFRQLGRIEVRQGRGVDGLQTAYRIGGRVAWRRMAEIGQRAQVPLRTMCRLAEAVFAYIDELSSLSIEGYAAAQAREQGTLERRRRRLLELILAQPPTPRDTLLTAARAARFSLPSSVVAVALEPRRGVEDAVEVDFAEDVLLDLEGPEPYLLAGAETSSLTAPLAGWRGAVGPRVRLADAAESLRVARDVLDLVRQGVLPSAPLTDSSAHLTTVWLLSDEFLGRQLAAERLGVLAELTEKQQVRLGETLLAWLRTQGNVLHTAAELDVHPQTVRYRLHRLTALFGAALDDPDARFDLELALRAQRLRPETAPPGEDHHGEP